MDMRVIPAGLLAAAAAWPVNGLLLRAAGCRAVIYLSPLAEEAAKTGCALLLNTSIPFTHITFGLIEALWDAAGPGRGRLAGLISLAGHAVFGYGTLWLYSYSNSIWPALAGVYLVHTGWNALVMYLSGAREGFPR